MLKLKIGVRRSEKGETEPESAAHPGNRMNMGTLPTSLKPSLR